MVVSILLTVVVLIAIFLSDWCCAAAPLVVNVDVIQDRDLTATVSADCTVRASRRARLTAGVSGRVDRVAVTEGERVRAGQTLVTIAVARADADERRMAAAVAEARVQVEQARLQVRVAEGRLSLARSAEARLEVLWQDRQVARSEYQAAVDEVEVARAEVAGKQAAFGEAESLLRVAEADQQGAWVASRETVVRAPFAAVVARVHVAEGLQVRAAAGRYRGSTLLDLESVNGVRVEALVPATDLPAVVAGQPVAVRVHALPDREFAGLVRAVGVEAYGVGADVEIETLGSWAGVRPGFSCAMEIVTADRRGVVAVPRLALLSRDEVLGVWRVEVGRLAFVPVRTGVSGDVHVEVLSGLAAGDRVVIGPFDVAGKLEPAQRVQPVVRKFNGF